MLMSDESKIQSVCRKLVGREVYHCASYLVSHFAQHPNACCDGVDYDDVLNLCQRMPDHSERIEEIEEAISNLENLDQSNPYKTAEEVEELHMEISKLESEKDDLESDDDPIEAYEHWIISDWFAGKLAEKGEITGELLGLTLWGRTCTGQAICLDSVIREIASDMGILPGQPNAWE